MPASSISATFPKLSVVWTGQGSASLRDANICCCQGLGSKATWVRSRSLYQCPSGNQYCAHTGTGTPQSLVDQDDMGNSLRIAATAQRREEGSFYSSIEDVFSAQPVLVTDADWNLLRRTPHQANAITEYAPVIAAMTVNDDPALGSSSSESLESDTPDLKGKKSKLAQGAHLFPHNKTCAVAFGPTSEMAVGQNLINDTIETRTRKRHRLVVGVMENRASKRQKLRNSGLKHNILNKVRIKGQKEYMDNRPCMLIIPILSLAAVKAWKSGDPYYAVVCIGGNRDDQGRRVEPTADEVYADVFTELLPLCSRDPELFTAVELLTCFTKGIAQSLIDGEMFHGWYTNPEELQKLQVVQTKLINAGNRVHVPILNNDKTINPFRDFRVARIRFDADDNSLPSPPDPFLLATKAAIIWSWRNGEKLLPGCFTPEEEECSECDRMQEYAKHLHETRIRPCNHIKIAQGLGLEADETTEFLLGRHLKEQHEKPDQEDAKVLGYTQTRSCTMRS